MRNADHRGAHAPSRVPTGALAGWLEGGLRPSPVPSSSPVGSAGRQTQHARARALPADWPDRGFATGRGRPVRRRSEDKVSKNRGPPVPPWLLRLRTAAVRVGSTRALACSNRRPRRLARGRAWVEPRALVQSVGLARAPNPAREGACAPTDCARRGPRSRDRVDAEFSSDTQTYTVGI
jgi:hypothetical protein